jgi:hypothetical protein
MKNVKYSDSFDCDPGPVDWVGATGVYHAATAFRVAQHRNPPPLLWLARGHDFPPEWFSRKAAFGNPKPSEETSMKSSQWLRP